MNSLILLLAVSLSYHGHRLPGTSQRRWLQGYRSVCLYRSFSVQKVDDPCDFQAKRFVQFQYMLISYRRSLVKNGRIARLLEARAANMLDSYTPVLPYSPVCPDNTCHSQNQSSQLGKMISTRRRDTSMSPLSSLGSDILRCGGPPSYGL
jgi:hypothetical protein